MYDDEKLGAVFPVRTGQATGHSNERQMLDRVSDTSSFRTEMRSTPDGTTLLRTKGGMPQFATIVEDDETEMGLPAGLSAQVVNSTSTLSKQFVFRVGKGRPLKRAHTNPPQGMPSFYAIAANLVGGSYCNGVAHWMLGAWRIGTDGRAWWKTWWSAKIAIPGTYVAPVVSIKSQTEHVKYLASESAIYDAKGAPVVTMTIPKRQVLLARGLVPYSTLPPQVGARHNFVALRCWDLQSFLDRDNHNITDSTLYVHSELVQLPSLAVSSHNATCCVDFGPIDDSGVVPNSDVTTIPENYRAICGKEWLAATPQGSYPHTFSGDSNIYYDPQIFYTVMSAKIVGGVDTNDSIRQDAAGASVRTTQFNSCIGFADVNGVATPINFVGTDNYNAPSNIIVRYVISALHGSNFTTQYVDASGDLGKTTEDVNFTLTESASPRVTVSCGDLSVPLFEFDASSRCGALKFNQDKTKHGGLWGMAWLVYANGASGFDPESAEHGYIPGYVYDKIWDAERSARGEANPFVNRANGQFLGTTLPYSWAEVNSWPLSGGSTHTQSEHTSNETEYSASMNYTAKGRYLLSFDADLKFAAYVECAVTFDLTKTSGGTKWRWVIPDEGGLGVQPHSVSVSVVVQHNGNKFSEVLFSETVNVRPNIWYAYMQNYYYFIWAHNGAAVMNEIHADGAGVICRYRIPDYRPQPSWFKSLDRVFHHQGINPHVAGFSASDNVARNIQDSTVIASQRVKFSELSGVDWLFTWLNIDEPISRNPYETNPALTRRYGRSDALYNLFASGHVQYEYDTDGLRLWVNDIPLNSGMSLQKDQRYANCHRV